MSRDLTESVIKDGMIYNIEQFCGNLWCNYVTYEPEEYFDDEFKYKHINAIQSFCILICSIYIVAGRFDTCPEKYRVFLRRLYTLYIGYLMFMGPTESYIMESKTCSYYHDCVSINHDGMNHLRSSTHYYILYNEECPSVMDLILSYEESNSEIVDDDCGDDCCYIDITCNTYIREDLSYYDYNHTISKRAESGDEKTGMIPLHINSKNADCYNYQIEELIISYIKLNEEYYDNIYAIIVFTFIFINIIVMITILINECFPKKEGQQKERRSSEHQQLRASA